MPILGKSKLQTITRLLSIAIVAIILSGCSLFGKEKPIEITTVPTTRLPLLIPDLPPLSIRSPKWIVITPNNADEVWARLEAQGSDIVLFALTDDGYEHLALTLTQIRNRIHLQREIILQYKEYYESPARP